MTFGGSSPNRFLTICPVTNLIRTLLTDHHENQLFDVNPSQSEREGERERGREGERERGREGEREKGRKGERERTR